MKNISLALVRRTLAEYIARGVVDDRVLQVLDCGGSFFPKECELWDYKREIGVDAAGRAEIVKDVVSLYNTFGGYLIYGIEEVERDLTFNICGIKNGSFAPGDLNALVNSYVGLSIDCTFCELTWTSDGTPYLIGLLHVPKRPSSQSPALFVRNGPQVNKRPIFSERDIYLREGAVSHPAKDHHQLTFLFGPRRNQDDALVGSRRWKLYITTFPTSRSSAQGLSVAKRTSMNCGDG